MEKSGLKSGFVYAFILLSILAVVFNGEAVAAGMRSAVNACLDTMIPSLYAMMILSEIFISSGIMRHIARFLDKPAKLLFGADGRVMVIFLFSQVSGYPIGARMLCRLCASGNLSKRQASLLAGVSYAGGPAFLSALFAGTSHDAALVFAAGAISNLLIFSIICRTLKIRNSCSKRYDKISPVTTSIVNAASVSGTALLKVCAMVILFGGISGTFESFGICRLFPERIYNILLGFAEISRITDCLPYGSNELPILGAMLSFGGICVLMQISAVTEGKLSIKPVIIIRIIAAILTWSQLYIWQMLHPADNAVTAAATEIHSSVVSAATPVPSLLLILMTVMLLLSADKRC